MALAVHHIIVYALHIFLAECCSFSIVTQECKYGSKTCRSGRFWVPHFHIITCYYQVVNVVNNPVTIGNLKTPVLGNNGSCEAGTW